MESATAETKKNTENFNCDRRTDDDRCQEISFKSACLAFALQYLSSSLTCLASMPRTSAQNELSHLLCNQQTSRRLWLLELENPMANNEEEA